MIKNCYIRVDANGTIGTGHLVRTETLADKLAKEGINIFFICNTIPDDYKIKLENKNYIVIDIKEKKELSQISDILKNTKNNILIIDSDKKEFYTKKFQTKIREQGNKLMIITFYNDYHFYADIVLNQNIMALSQEYSSEPYTKLLLGPKNVILNDKYREITKKIDRYKTNLPNKTVLISFGGVDKPNRTELVYQALNKIPNKPDKIIIILGTLYQHKNKIEKLVKKSNIKTEIYQNTPKMPYLLAESDIVFSSGGLTVWEAGVFKTLSAIIGFTEREQIGGKFLDKNKLAIYIDDYYNINQDKLIKKTNAVLSENNKKITENLYSEIDVNGIYNSISAIKSFVSEK